MCRHGECVMIGRDPEFALLVACAAWPPSDRRVERVRGSAAAGIDWGRFVRIVARHRMAGMAANGLFTAGIVLPAESGLALRRAAQADLVQALSTAREAARLVALLSDAEIGSVVLKGPPLSALIYGTLAVRQVRDLDLLVNPGNLLRALELLRGQGYELHYSAGDKGLRPDRSTILKDVELVHPATGLIVELHARLNNNAEMLSTSIVDAVRSVAVGGGLDLPALSGEPLLVYLMVHGFRHGWVRLKWLADVAAMVSGMTPTELGRLLDAMRSRGLYVVGASTLLALHDVMGIELPPGIERKAQRSRRARVCATLAVHQLVDEREPDRHMMLNLAMEGTMLLASSAPRYLRGEVVRLLVDDPFVQRFGGSRKMVALSVLLRPLLWSGRKIASLARATPGRKVN
jgi:hypothetical protein